MSESQGVGYLGYLMDPDVDLEAFGRALHHAAVITRVSGGFLLRCTRCGVQGLRLYQDHGTATHYQFIVNERLPLGRDTPNCEIKAPATEAA